MMTNLKLSSKHIEATPADRAALMAKLDTIKQRLQITLGAVSMFLLLGVIEPRIMETDLAPLIWFFLMILPPVMGIYLLASPVWRPLPLTDRRACAVGAIAIGLLMFGYLPLRSFIITDNKEGILFLFFTTLISLILYSGYKWLGRPSKPSASQNDSELFP